MSYLLKIPEIWEVKIDHFVEDFPLSEFQVCQKCKKTHFLHEARVPLIGTLTGVSILGVLGREAHKTPWKTGISEYVHIV